MPSLSSLVLRVGVRLLLGLLLLVSLCLEMVRLSPHAQAAPNETLTVTDCTGESGPGQIGSVLASASAGDTITFSCSGTIPITSTLTINTNLTLDGSGQSVTLDGGNTTQVLIVNGGVTFTLNALTIAHGYAANAFICSACSAGLLNEGTTTISNSSFTQNVNNNGDGAAIYNTGALTISTSSFTGNSIKAYAVGAAIANYGTLSISTSTFASNHTYSAGAAIGNWTTATISSSTFTYNSVYGDIVLGGAIYDEGTLIISDSTFAHNSVGTDGQGGAIYMTDGSLYLSNSTIADNSAGSGGQGGGLFGYYGTTSISGSIVADNTVGSGGQGPNCFSEGGLTNTDNGYNITNDKSCRFTGTGSLQNTDPRFDPYGLQNNGGPTQTLALEPSSPAVDHLPVGSSCPTTDQRGVSRPQGPACDVGAFEMTTADGLTVMVHVVNSFQLSQSLQSTLDNQLQETLTAVNQSHTQEACSDLATFLSDVRSDTGNGLTTSQGTELRIDGFVIKTYLGGC